MNVTFYKLQLKDENENWERRFELLQHDFLSTNESFEGEVARLTSEIQNFEAKLTHANKEVDRLNTLLKIFEKEDEYMTSQIS